ncbi:MAG: SDR family oxidoreductase [Deltaproteobacteria bacterium]|nr:SDR family oxidoreductase [Deltaproteobacteria bacterium]
MKTEQNQNVNLKGKVSLVTGATSGHGQAVARALAKMGSEVVLLGRSREKCIMVRDEIAALTGRPPDYLLCDLSVRDDIDRAANEFLASGRPLDILVNNAGIVNRTRQETTDGVEMVFAVNYLAYFQLSLRLIERLLQSTPARIVNVASDAHRVVSLKLDDLELRNGYSWWSSYGRSKLAVVYFTQELARRLAGSGVTVNAVDPGPVASNIAMNNPGILVSLTGKMIKHLFPGPDWAARTAVYLATSPDVERVNGAYFKYHKLRAPRIDTGDRTLPGRLWEITAKMTGVDFLSDQTT